MAKTAVYAGSENENAHGRNRTNYKMLIASLKANHFFLLSQRKICKQKRSGIRVHTITNNV